MPEEFRPIGLPATSRGERTIPHILSKTFVPFVDVTEARKAQVKSGYESDNLIAIFQNRMLGGFLRHCEIPRHVARADPLRDHFWATEHSGLNFLWFA
jgi:hypothetical protein